MVESLLLACALLWIIVSMISWNVVMLNSRAVLICVLESLCNGVFFWTMLMCSVEYAVGNVCAYALV